MALERDADGRVRASEINDPWQPPFDQITNKRDARAYINAELRHLGDGMRRRWWHLRNGWLEGDTPNEWLGKGRYEQVWSAAVRMRGMN